MVDNEPGVVSGRIRAVGMLAGTASGLTKVAVGHGFDTIKTRLQCSPPGTYKGAIDCLIQTVRNESAFALYKGATPPAIGWAGIDSVLLGSLHNYRLLLIRSGMTELVPGTDSRRLTVVGHGIAGLLAGWTSALVATPIELVKVKLQMQTQRLVHQRQFTGPIHCAKEIWKSQGPLGLWTGFGGSIAFRSNFMWMFMGVEMLMRAFTRLEMNTGLSTFFAGGLSSFAFWIMAIPADNVKNRMMAAALGSQRRSAFTVAKHILITDGPKGLYRGLAPCLVRAFPVNASALFAYEGLMKFFGAEKTRL